MKQETVFKIGTALICIELVMAFGGALAQTTSELDEAYKSCRAHWTNHPVTVGGKSLTVLGYEPGWEKCGDVEQAYYIGAQKAQAAKQASDIEADRQKALGVAVKVAPPTPPPRK